MIAGPHGGGSSPPPANVSTLGLLRAEDYGAHSVQSGAADASGGISLAIVIAAGQGGGVVLLDSGLTYAVRRTIVLLPNVELMLPTGTVLQAAAGLVGDVVSATNAAGVRISGGGTIDANRAAGTTGNGVTLTGCAEAQLEELTVLNAWQDGIALVNCTRTVLDVLVGECGRHGLYHSGSTFSRGQVSARDNGQRVAGSGVVFDAASTDNGYGPIVATDTRAGGAKTQQFGVLEVPASACDRNVFAPSALTGNAAGTVSLVGANSGTPLAPGSVTLATLAAGAVDDSKIAAGGLHNASLAGDTARANLLVNGNFQIVQRPPASWSNGGPFPPAGGFAEDRWQLYINGGASTFGSTQTHDTTPADLPGVWATAAVAWGAGATATGANPIGVAQKLEDYLSRRGRPCSLSMWVYATAPNQARIFINDGIQATAFSAFHPGDSLWHLLTVANFTPSNNSTTLWVGMQAEANGAARATGAALVDGAVPCSSSIPSLAADDLLQCQRYYELVNTGTGGNNQCAGQCFSATQAQFPIVYKVQKAVTPTVTFAPVGSYAVTNAGGAGLTPTAVSAIAVTDKGTTAVATVAAGLVAGNASLFQNWTGGGTVVLEANP